MPKRAARGTREASERVLARLRSTAYHEAGHAVAAYWHRIRLDGATIEPDADSQGKVRHGNPLAKRRPDVGETGRRNRERMEALVLTGLAGSAAQRRFSPRSVRSWHGRQDLKNAVDLVSYFVGSSEELDAYAHLMFIRANAFVALPHVWTAIGTVAERLIRQQRMGRTELRRTVRAALSTSAG